MKKDEQGQANMVNGYFLTKSVHPSGVNLSWGRKRDLYSILAEPLTQ
jgi:hypothetical protein